MEGPTDDQPTTIEPNDVPPTTLVIFGVTGNLSISKLLPAIYQLFKLHRLPENFRIVGIFRRPPDVDSLIQQLEINLLRKHNDVDDNVLGKIKSIFQTINMDSTKPEDFHRLSQLLDGIDNESNVMHNRLFYLAIPPDIFKHVVSCLAEAGLNNQSNGRASRILIEKPFGSNLENAKELVEHLNTSFSEQQIYRIDHYLAKETAQNILSFRFNNPIVEDIWGRQFIDHIQITAAETIDIEGRVAFYENMGALRDIIQSHLLQLMTLITMESPKTMTSEDIHTEKQELLNAIQPIKTNHVDEVAVRGQYEGYLEEVNNPDSKVETFVALMLEVANSRWGGVPILLRTGKALASKITEITVVFKDRSRRNVPENLLTIRIQPNEGIFLKLTAKKPGFDNELQPVNMSFQYRDSFDDVNPDAYERVLVDAMIGDQSLFATSAEVIRCWEILEPVLQTWQNESAKPTPYKKGSWGPSLSDELATNFGVEWHSDTFEIKPSDKNHGADERT